MSQVSLIRTKSRWVRASKPSEGNEWINLNIAIENSGSKQEYVTTLGQMYIVDKDGNQYQIAVINKAMENISNFLDGTVVAKAKKTRWVGFEVPTTATGLTFRYNAIGNIIDARLFRDGTEVNNLVEKHDSLYARLRRSYLGSRQIDNKRENRLKIISLRTSKLRQQLVKSKLILIDCFLTGFSKAAFRF